MKNDRQYTEDWKLRQSGIDYNNQITPGYYPMLDENEAMERGDQWRGVKNNGLDTATVNIIKPSGNYLVAATTGEELTMQVSTVKISADRSGYDQEAVDMAKLVTKQIEQIAEENKLENKKQRLGHDAFKTGDMAVYAYFDPTLKTGQYKGKDPETGEPVEVMGKVVYETIDGCNVFAGDPSNVEINCNGRPTQKYILLQFKKMTSDVQKEAKENSIKNWKDIVPDKESDDNYQVGDAAQYNNDSKESNMTTVLLKLWVKDGSVWARKSTKTMVIKKDYDTKSTLFPLAFRNWEERKNCYHGQSPVTYMIPNQRFINKRLSIEMVIALMHATPKTLLDTTKIKSVTNKIGEVLKCTGDINNAYRTVEPPRGQSNVLELIDTVITYTKEMVGANDTLLGNINPEQASGRSIIAVQRQAQVPIELPKNNMKQLYEDLGNITVDLIAANYGERDIIYQEKDPATDEMIDVVETVDYSKARDLSLSMKIDVGATPIFSEEANVQTLDNLLQSERISFLRYLKMMPTGYINGVEELIEEIENQQAQEQEQPQITEDDLAAIYGQLSAEEQQQLDAMTPEQRAEALYNIAIS